MIPVILSGGSGTRLWPVSREAFPKQFADIFEESLLAKTLNRLSDQKNPWIITVGTLQVLTERCLQELSLEKNVLYEPFGKNTAPAIAWLCHTLQKKGLGKEVVGVFPADHLIQNQNLFRQALAEAEVHALKGEIVTLGLQPTSAHTGYGYIEVAAVKQKDASFEALKALRFCEKPDSKTAQKFVESGKYFWNAGIFVFQVDRMAQALEASAPEVWKIACEIENSPESIRRGYEKFPSISIDYAVMEKLPSHVCIAVEGLGWSDVGSWDEVLRQRPQANEIIESESSNNAVWGASDKTYSFVGTSDLLVVDTPDALLISKKGESQKVKDVVDQLKKKGSSRVRDHHFEIRPWGKFEILRDTDKFKSKVIEVLPGRQLSYQSHKHRAEHWIIVQGQPEVVLDGKTLKPKPGEAIYIPLGAKHRIRNPGTELVQFVEVQVGTYFGEDDITRYEDDYGRS